MVKSHHLLPQILTKYTHLLQNPGKNCILTYMKLSSYAKHIGIHYNTAWRMWKRGQIAGYQLPTGTVIINPPNLARHAGARTGSCQYGGHSGG